MASPTSTDASPLLLQDLAARGGVALEEVVSPAVVVRPEERPRRWHGWLVALVAFVTFANSLGNYFMLDDYWLLDWSSRSSWSEVAKPYEFGGSEDYKRFWFNASRLDGKSGEGYFRPSVSVVYKGLYGLCGLDARVFHASSIALHVATSLAVLWLASFFFRRRESSFVLALAFAAHPAHAETVQWLGANTYLLVAPFYLLALGFFLRSRQADGSAWHYTAAFICFPLALAGHELAITLPAALLAVDLWANRARPEESASFPSLTLPTMALRQVIFGAFALTYLIWHFGVFATLQQDKGGSTYLHDTAHPVSFLLGCLFQLAYGLTHLVFPFPFAPVDAEDFTTWMGAPALAATCVLVLTVVTYALYRLVGWSARVLLATTLFLLPLVPTFLVAPTQRQLYLPSFGICLLLTLGYERLATRGRPPRRLAAILLVAGMALAWTYNVMWSFPSNVARAQVQGIQRELPHMEKGASIYLLNLWGPSFGVEMMPALLAQEPTLDVQVLTIHPKLLPVGEHRVDNEWLRRFFTAVLPEAFGEAPVDAVWEAPDVLRVRIRGARFMRSLIEGIYPAAVVAQTVGGRVETTRFTAEVVEADADGVECLRFRFHGGGKPIVIDLQGGRARRL